ncbi:preprotein translocase subunit SecE [Magnetococcales bacterium HHB-1]
MGDFAQIKKYLQEVQTELKKVVWPTRRDTTTTTMVVFGMVVVFALFLWLVDTLLGLLIQGIIG